MGPSLSLRGAYEREHDQAAGRAEELRQAVEWALNEGVTLDVRGEGSKLALGKPMLCDQVVDLSGLSGIVDYAPEELVVTLRAGTPMREVEALLAQRNQMLAFEPPDLGPLLGRAPGQGTLVGAVMGNLAGSRRLRPARRAIICWASAASTDAARRSSRVAA